MQHLLPKQAMEADRAREKAFRVLLEEGRLPEQGWPEAWINQWLWWLSSLDCNNQPQVCGVGEREGRVYSRLVANRHYGFAHGIGRSGSLEDAQPKAAGSTLLQGLVTRLAGQALGVAGIRREVRSNCLVVPMATGMTLALCLHALGAERPGARFVLWSRIDQKSGLKAIVAAGFVPVVIPLVKQGEELRVDLKAMAAKIDEIGPDNFVAVLSTTSCFAPRVPDNLIRIGELCKGIPHLINNAYGLQSSRCVQLLNQATIDLVVQSTDKNFMVPVGGALVFGPRADLLARVSAMYAGRASISPLLDLAITLLEMGQEGYRRLLTQQRNNYAKLRQGLLSMGLRVMDTPHNDISLAVALPEAQGGDLGGKLFYRQVSGCRVIANPPAQTIGGLSFANWGSHCDDPQDAYFNVAAALGQSEAEIDRFLDKLSEILNKAR